MSETLLAGYDGSEEGRRAVEFAAGRAALCGARLVVAYVIEWSPYSFHTPEELEERHKRREEELDRAEEQMLKPLVQALQSKGATVESVVRHGHAVEVMTKLAQEYSASEMFVGRRGQTRVQSLLFGGLATSLIQVAPVPVTVVP